MHNLLFHKFVWVRSDTFWTQVLSCGVSKHACHFRSFYVEVSIGLWVNIGHTENDLCCSLVHVVLITVNRIKYQISSWSCVCIFIIIIIIIIIILIIIINIIVIVIVIVSITLIILIIYI